MLETVLENLLALVLEYLEQLHQHVEDIIFLLAKVAVNLVVLLNQLYNVSGMEVIVVMVAVIAVIDLKKIQILLRNTLPIKNLLGALKSII